MIIFILSLLCWLFLVDLNSHYNIGDVPYRRRGGGGDVTTTTKYNYQIKFPHNSIDPSQVIFFYDTYGVELYALPPYYPGMDYGKGILTVPGSKKNSVVETVSTATYYVYYSDDKIIIDYEKALIKISKELIKVPADTIVKATFEYIHTLTQVKDINSVIDGKWDSQVQTVFFAEPPTGYHYAILDLGSIKKIQTIDMVAGFYKPDGQRKYDIDMNLTIQYSVNNTDYYEISDKTHNFHLTGGQSISFEEADLGVGFEARYLKLLIENVKRIEFSEKGQFVIAISEITAYSDIILKSDVKLIPTNVLTTDVNISDVVINVTSTASFEVPESAETKTAYILNSDNTYDSFTYTDVTDTSFTGVSDLTTTHDIGSYVVQEISGDTTLYDYNNLLPKLGDRIYKVNKISDERLFTQSQLDYVAKKFQQEFNKNHNKVSLNLLYAPHLNVGQTVELIDPYNNTNQNYFVEGIQNNNGFYSLTLARYPGIFE